MGGRGIAGWARALVVVTVGVGGCAYPPVVETDSRAGLPQALDRRTAANDRGRKQPAPPEIVPAAHVEPATLPVQPGLDDLVALAVARNPRLAKATFAIDAARGRHIQAGLYPNPDLAINWDEIGDRTGHGGIVTLPKLSQTLVTGQKLSLAQAMAATEVDQATLALLGERYGVIAAVRAAYYDVYVLERRIAALEEMFRLAEEAVRNGKNLLENQKIARIDFVEIEAAREKARADMEAARRELPAARRALAAAIGDPRLPIPTLTGPLDELPIYDPDRSLELVLATHPEARSARVGVERARAAVRRAQADAIPNLTFYTGYIRQYENQSHDFAMGVNGALPVWNRNQGSIRAAQAELGAAIQEVGRVENDLADRVASAFRVYDAARQRVELYRTSMLPKLREMADLSLKAFQGGQFDFVKLVLARRTVVEAVLEYNKSLADAWKAAAQLSGLLLEESWPDPPRDPQSKPAPPPHADPKPGPKPIPTPSTAKPGPRIRLHATSSD